jgi:hypothetical protein
MAKKKEIEKNPAETLRELVNEVGAGFSNSFEDIFEDVATSIENVFNSADCKKDKK